LIIVNLKKLFIALLGSICLYLIVNNYIVEVSILQYIIIEALVTAAHFLYEQIKPHIEDIED